MPTDVDPIQAALVARIADLEAKLRRYQIGDADDEFAVAGGDFALLTDGRIGRILGGQFFLEIERTATGVRPTRKTTVTVNLDEIDTFIDGLPE